MGILFFTAVVPPAEIYGQLPSNDVVTGDIPDQQYAEDFSDARYHNVYSYGPINAYQEYAQTFTVGKSGQLSHVEIYGEGPWFKPVTLSIYGFSGTVSDQILGSRTLAPGNPTFKRWISFDLRSAGIDINVGDVLAIALSGDSNGEFEWISSLWGNPKLIYAGGGVYNRLIKDSSGTPINMAWYPLDGTLAANDLLYRTFVSVVPEPAMVPMVTCSLMGILLLTRRRHGRRQIAGG